MLDRFIQSMPILAILMVILALLDGLHRKVIPGLMDATTVTDGLFHLVGGVTFVALAAVCVAFGCKWAVQLGDDMMDDDEDQEGASEP